MIGVNRFLSLRERHSVGVVAARLRVAARTGSLCGNRLMDVCGVDPGLGVSGYAILSLEDQRGRVRDAGICRTDRTASLPQRLAQIDSDFTGLLEQWRPRVVGVEQLYSHYHHPRTAILMGHARGVILAVAARFGIAVRSLSATQVKRSLTGNGRASKAQVQRAVMAELRLVRRPEPADVADALAVALCCIRVLRAENTLEPGPRERPRS